MKKRDAKKAGRNKNFIYDNFMFGLFYIKKNWVFLVAAFILLIITFFIGYFGVIGILFPELGKSIDSLVLTSIEEMIKETQGLSPIDLTIFIMSNNIKTAFFGLVSGIFFAISPIVIILFNGYVVGFVAERAVTNPLNTEGILILWRLFPHGIFEIPAILVSIAAGIRLGMYPLYLKEKGKGFLSLLVMIIVFFILSGIAALILSLFIGSFSLGLDSSKEFYNKLSENPLANFVLYLLIALSFILSVLAGLKVLSVKDRKNVWRIILDSIRVFVFIIIPLLVIAGLIEGLLIFLVG